MPHSRVEAKSVAALSSPAAALLLGDEAGGEIEMKYVAIWLASAALAAAATGAAAQDRAALVKRGDYLVNNIGGCNDCHSPLDATGKIPPGRALTGAQLIFAPTVPLPEWAPVAPPLAGGPADYTEAQLVSFLQTGKRPDGSTARPPMPAFRLTEEDARAVAAYLASLRPGG
jgi:mono/diheme cytochrome c family protein